MDVNAHLGRDNLRNLVQHAYAIDTADADGSVEEKHLVHIPLDVEDTIAKA